MAPTTSPERDETALITQAPKLPLPAVVRVVGVPAKPETFPLRSGRCVIGAGSDADVVLVDATVSRRHVELALVPEGVSVTDLSSRNGTFYLGQRVEKITLALGSRLRVGSSEIILEADQEELASRGGGPPEYRGLVGESPAMRKLFSTLSRLEGSLVNVLIQGESGVGKELIARALHEGSSLAAGPFVPINCGALPRELVASELFGHRKGAFTGALEARSGAFERADGGTLFLDEIGELPLDVQPVLLRALESGEVRPVGGDVGKSVRVRVLAATNRNLSQDAAGGRFREDLYFRLAVVTLLVPPLRERPDDIPALAARFASDVGYPGLPPDVVAELSSRPWPGNVRELRNAIQAYVALGDLPAGRAAVADDELDRILRKATDPSRPYTEQKDELGARFTRIYLELVMRKVNGNQSEAAKVAGLDRGYFGKLLAKHGVTK